MQFCLNAYDTFKFNKLIISLYTDIITMSFNELVGNALDITIGVLEGFLVYYVMVGRLDN